MSDILSNMYLSDCDGYGLIPWKIGIEDYIQSYFLILKKVYSRMKFLKHILINILMKILIHMKRYAFILKESYNIYYKGKDLNLNHILRNIYRHLIYIHLSV